SRYSGGRMGRNAFVTEFWLFKQRSNLLVLVLLYLIWKVGVGFNKEDMIRMGDEIS
ncbi:hypothetical protein FRX31_035349, partial [Thalictrum thalictroides]